MAQFIATIQGQRGQASRLGSKSSGLTANVNGWHIGVKVEILNIDDKDVIRIYTNKGSNCPLSDILLAEIKEGEKIYLAQ